IALERNRRDGSGHDLPDRARHRNGRLVRVELHPDPVRHFRDISLQLLDLRTEERCKLDRRDGPTAGLRLSHGSEVTTWRPDPAAAAAAGPPARDRRRRAWIPAPWAPRAMARAV